MRSDNPKDRETQALKKEIQKLKTENHYLNYVINRLPVSIYWKNKEGVYLGCNQYVANMAGVKSAEDIIGKTDEKLPWKQYSAHLKAIDNRIIEQQTIEELEEKPIANGDNDRYFLTTKGPLCDEDNKTIGVMGVSVDITERKKMEQELIVAKEKAEIANKAKEQFLYNMRHDIRTPFSGISGLTEVIIAEEKDPEKLQYLHAIHASSQQLLDYLNEILELTQIQDGNVPILSQPIPLKDTAQHCVEMFLPALEENKLSFSFEYDKALPEEVLTDEFRVKRILINLLGNAVKFTPTGSIHLKIYLPEENPKNDEILVALSVEDTGIGIPKDKQAIIFEKFERLSPSYEGKYGGSGLGLFSVKTLTNELGGSIQLKSAPNKGSTFTCMIPMKKPKGSALQLSKNTSTLHSVLLNFSQKKIPLRNSQNTPARILLVEDAILVQLAISSLFKELNCTIDTANTGEEAIRFYQANHNRYHFILMDIGLPDTNGYEVTKKIRAMPGGDRTPIIALTAHAMKEVQAQCLTAGMNDVLQKPLSRSQALELLRAYIPNEDKAT